MGKKDSSKRTPLSERVKTEFLQEVIKDFVCQKKEKEREREEKGGSLEIFLGENFIAAKSNQAKQCY